jgi:hypothetical protein
MPRLTMETSHGLGREEAIRRLKEKFGAVRASYGSQVNDLQEQWDDHRFSFGFKTLGMDIAGTVQVEDASVKLSLDLPLVAMLFKGTIQEHIRREIGELLV